MTATVNLTITEGVAELQFNRPEAMNAFNWQLAEDLDKALEELMLEKSFRVVTLSGAGPVFMAGGDIHFFNERLTEMPKGVPAIIRQLNSCIQRLQQLPVPVLACVHGAVAGAGISLMLACDLVLAASSTKFTLAYANLGTTPDGGATYFLPRTVGMKKAMELILLSERFSAEQALAMNLINWIEPDESFSDRIQILTNRLAKGPTQMYGRAKRLLNEGLARSLPQQLEAEMTAFTNSTQTQDFKRGVRAFIAKEQAHFEGN